MRNRTELHVLRHFVGEISITFGVLAKNLGLGLGGVHEKNVDAGSKSTFALGPRKKPQKVLIDLFSG